MIDLYSKSIELNEVVAASENELQLVYSSPTPYTLSIIMNPATQRLASARVSLAIRKLSPLISECYRFSVSPWIFPRLLKLLLMQMMLSDSSMVYIIELLTIANNPPLQENCNHSKNFIGKLKTSRSYRTSLLQILENEGQCILFMTT